MNIVFDIGGTNMRVASAEGTTLGEIKKVPTPQSLDETIQTLAIIAKELSKGAIERAAGCIPGQIDALRGVYDANNRKLWLGRHFDVELFEALGAPVQVENDCSIIGLGEYTEGAGKGSHNMAYITVSTGVGIGHIVDGKIVPIGDLLFGHELVDGEELEQLISGTAVKKKFGIEPKELESIDERNKLADILARGLVKVAEKWQPDTIVLGGSMIVGVNPIPVDRVQKTLANLVQHPPTVKMAELKDNGGLVGAAILASQYGVKIDATH